MHFDTRDDDADYGSVGNDNNDTFILR